MSLRRRQLLAGSVLPLAGCVGSVFGEDDTVLGAPSDRRGDTTHPTWGEDFPDFSIPDPHTGETVSRDDLTADGPFVMTFIFTSCQDRCGELIRLLGLMQADAIDEGWDDSCSFVAMTFDPETDDADTLTEYGTVHGVDVDHDRFRFLRPTDGETAIALVDEHFGVPAERMDDHDDGHHDDHDHDNGHHDDHDNGHHDDHDHDNGHHERPSHAHYYMYFLVNGDGIVERSYPSPILFDRTPEELIDTVRTVVT